MKEYMLKQVDYHAWANLRLFNRLKELPNYETIFNEQIQSVLTFYQYLLYHGEPYTDTTLTTSPVCGA